MFHLAFVCLLATSHQNYRYRLDLDENFTRYVSFDKEELITFCKSSAAGSGTRFFEDPSTLQDAALFHSLGLHFTGSYLS